MLFIYLISAIFFIIPTLEATDINSSDLFKQVKNFPIEEKLEDRIKFWIDIYSKYSKNDLVLHDTRYPQVIFEVVHIKNKNDLKKAEEKKEKYTLLLSSIDLKQMQGLSPEADQSSFSPAEKKIISLYQDISDEKKFSSRESGRKVRGQYGLKESFRQGLFESGRFIPAMKKIIKKFNLPEEIVFLPFLESGFDQRALSRVGASGLWQFMPSTGKFFLRVDDVVDERNDPLKAAEGAALLVKDNLEVLKEWPLAITAYNHGRAGVSKAVKKVKSTSMAKIINEYNGPNFGFASANYYSAFIAAVIVAKNFQQFFGEVEQARPLSYDEFVMPEYMDIRVLAKHVGMDLDLLKTYNPALSADVYKGKKYIPVGYTLRIPYSEREQFWLRYKLIPKPDRKFEQVSTSEITENSKSTIPSAKEEQL